MLMFYNNVTLYRKAIFRLKTCVSNNNNNKIHKKKHSGSKNAGYISSSQLIFMVFALLILRETLTSTCSGLFLSLVTTRTPDKDTMCANSSLALVLNPSPSRKRYACMKIISLSDQLYSRLNRSDGSTVLGLHDFSLCC